MTQRRTCSLFITSLARSGIDRRIQARVLGLSPSGRPGCPDPHRIDRSARCHEQTTVAITAEAHIGTTLRQLDVPYRLARLVEDHDAVEAIEGPPAPKIAVHVDT